MTEQLNAYYKEVRQHLRCPKADQQRFLADAKKRVEALREENPQLDYDGVVAFLGSPQDLANAFMDSLDPAVVQAYDKKKKRRRTGLIVVLLVIIIALAIFSAWVIHLKSTAEFTYEEIIVITQDGPVSSTP